MLLHTGPGIFMLHRAWMDVHVVGSVVVPVEGIRTMHESSGLYTKPGVYDQQRHRGRKRPGAPRLVCLTYHTHIDGRTREPGSVFGVDVVLFGVWGSDLYLL